MSRSGGIGEEFVWSAGCHEAPPPTPYGEKWQDYSCHTDACHSMRPEVWGEVSGESVFWLCESREGRIASLCYG